MSGITQFDTHLAAETGIEVAILAFAFYERFDQGGDLVSWAHPPVPGGPVPCVEFTLNELSARFPFWDYETLFDTIRAMAEIGFLLVGHDYDEANWRTWATGTVGAEMWCESDPVDMARVYNHAGTNQRKGRRGYVYLLKSLDGYYKIGKSVEPAARIHNLGVVLPFPIETEHYFSCDDYSEAETALHRKYADFRLKGEWFNLPDAEVAWIKSVRRYEETVFVKRRK